MLGFVASIGGGPVTICAPPLCTRPKPCGSKGWEGKLVAVAVEGGINTGVREVVEEGDEDVDRDAAVNARSDGADIELASGSGEGGPKASGGDSGQGSSFCDSQPPRSLFCPCLCPWPPFT
jgi:hypothetical protein